MDNTSTRLKLAVVKDINFNADYKEETTSRVLGNSPKLRGIIA